MTESSPESFSLLRLLLAVSTVAALMGLFAWGLHKISPQALFQKTVKNRNRRLCLVESLSIDTRRRLVVVRWDEKEHLLLLGPQHDIVVASSVAPPLSSDPSASHDQV